VSIYSQPWWRIQVFCQNHLKNILSCNVYKNILNAVRNTLITLSVTDPALCCPLYDWLVVQP